MGDPNHPIFSKEVQFINRAQWLTMRQIYLIFFSWTYHGCCSSCCLSSCCLIDLVLGSFDLSLQMGWRVKIFALFPWTSPFDVIHTDSNSIVVGINHCTVSRVSKPAIIFSSVTVATLILSTYLRAAGKNTSKITSGKKLNPTSWKLFGNNG